MNKTLYLLVKKACLLFLLVIIEHKSAIGQLFHEGTLVTMGSLESGAYNRSEILKHKIDTIFIESIAPEETKGFFQTNRFVTAYCFDNAGDLTKRIVYTTPNNKKVQSSLTYHYNAQGKLISRYANEDLPYHITYTYDNAGRLIRERSTYERSKWPDDSVVYQYDHNQLTKKIKLYNYNQSLYTYDYLYDQQNRLKETDLVMSTSAKTEKEITTISYDALGRVAVEKRQSDNFQGTQVYTYDQQGRLILVQNKGSRGNMDIRLSYNEQNLLVKEVEDHGNPIFVYAYRYAFQK